MAPGFDVKAGDPEAVLPRLQYPNTKNGSFFRAVRSAERDAKRRATAEAERLRLEDEANTREARDLRYVARKQKRK